MSDAKVMIYDDLAKKKREFVPRNQNRVNVYVCGVTVYGSCHIGHARAYIAFDIIRRWLEYRGFNIYHIQNFTDVDDKIINKANDEGVSIREVTDRYIDEYFKDMDALGVKRASIYPRATEYIDDMIEMVKTLIEKGYGYESDGNVFYDVAQFPGYGKLSGRGGSEAQMQEPAPGKRNNADFALWKKAMPEEPFWESPWGKGRPGWHLECSVMSLKLAGGPLDIHGGGMDLIFPHHENEIAQSEAYMGGSDDFSNYWVHNGFVEVDKEKMSKSIGNITNVSDILKKYDGNTMRFFFVGAHYRMPINYSNENVSQAAAGLERFRSMFQSVAEITSSTDEGIAADDALSSAATELSAAAAETQIEFERAMDDDFNTPAAIAQLFTLARKINAFAAAIRAVHTAKFPAASATVLASAAETIRKLSGILGLDLETTPESGSDDADKLMQIIIKVRAEARANKDWKTADLIRDMLTESGFTLLDKPDGTTWKKL